jgi:DNA ligase (NAD+)
MNIKKYEELKNKIHYHNYRYHVLDAPVISDYEYDQLLMELRQVESQHPDWITPDSPTQRAGAPPADGFVKVQHPAPILSLGNAFSEEDVRSWLERISKVDSRVLSADFAVEPKLDGLSVILFYQDGRFVQGSTRGDGEIGENITANIRTIKALPLKIPVGTKLNQQNESTKSSGDVKIPETLVVRGEAFIRIDDFKKLNLALDTAGEKTYVNPRNTAAGALRNLDPSLTASRPLTLLVYQIVSFESSTDEITHPPTQIETVSYLKSLGFPVPESIHCTDLDQVIKVYNRWQDIRENLDYEIDGMVIKINDHQLFNALGVVGKDPRGAIAYKFPAQEVTTQLLEIGVNVGRTGVLTPYAVLDPVEVGGVIVRQATLHNFDFIFEKDIRIGDRVRIKRAGDVIPYVIGPIEDLRTGNEVKYVPPTVCPVCEQPVEQVEGEVAWYCVNASCPAQLIRNVEHFVSRGAMDIVGVGIRIVEQLVSSRIIIDVADLYTLNREQLLGLEGFAEKKADNLLAAIQASKSQTLDRLLTALGIRGVGEALASLLVQDYHSLDELAGATQAELEMIEGIGPNIARAIVDWFENPKNKQVLDKLKNARVWPMAERNEETDRHLPLDGMTFVVTGTLPNFSRSEIKETIHRHGGRVTGTVSKKTNFVLTGDNPGSKLTKAQTLGVPIITEAEFIEMVGLN